MVALYPSPFAREELRALADQHRVRILFRPGHICVPSHLADPVSMFIDRVEGRRPPGWRPRDEDERHMHPDARKERREREERIEKEEEEKEKRTKEKTPAEKKKDEDADKKEKENVRHWFESPFEALRPKPKPKKVAAAQGQLATSTKDIERLMTNENVGESKRLGGNRCD